jgi:hypothetical protein
MRGAPAAGQSHPVRIGTEPPLAVCVNHW